MNFCNSQNDSNNSLEQKLGHQFLIEGLDDKMFPECEDIDITNLELIHLITQNNNLDTHCIDDRVKGKIDKEKFSDVVKIKKNFLTFDQNTLGSFEREKFLKSSM